MQENTENKTVKILYKAIECPTCGNNTLAKSIEQPQKCEHCRRLFKVTLKKLNKKEGRKAKYAWDSVAVDFEE